MDRVDRFHMGLEDVKRVDIDKMIRRAIRSGHWMIRSDRDGVSHGGFVWRSVGEWTYPEEFSKYPTCRDGLFGVSRKSGGRIGPGNRGFILRDGKVHDPRLR